MVSEGLAVDPRSGQENQVYTVTIPHNGEETDRAEQRRIALRQRISDSGMSIEEACRRAGLGRGKPTTNGRRPPSPANAVGNFLRRVTDSLNLSTLEPLAATLGCTVSELTGEVELRPVGRVIRYRLLDGKQHDPDEETGWFDIVLPLTPGPRHPNSRHFQPLGPEMNAVYPPNTVLEAVPLPDFVGVLANGNRVIVEIKRYGDNGPPVELCREIEHRGDAAFCLLVTRSRDKSFQNSAIMFPWPIDPAHVETLPNEDEVRVTARVVASRTFTYRAEPD